MAKRINFFKEFSVEGSIPSTPTKGKFKVNAHSAILLTILSIGVISIVFTRTMHKRAVKRIEQSIANAQSKLSDPKFTAPKREVASLKTDLPAAFRISKGWTGLIWQLSAMTDDDLLLKSLKLVQSGTKDKKSKTLTVNGEATSLESLRNWIQLLTLKMPHFHFALSRQSNDTKSTHQVQFEIIGEGT